MKKNKKKHGTLLNPALAGRLWEVVVSQSKNTHHDTDGLELIGDGYTVQRSFANGYYYADVCGEYVAITVCIREDGGYRAVAMGKYNGMTEDELVAFFRACPDVHEAELRVRKDCYN